MTCAVDCPNELPNCERFNDEGCRSGSQIYANEGVEKRRWQTPKPGDKLYQPSYQDYHSLVGYADIKYTSRLRAEADVCIIAVHKNPQRVTFKYYFNEIEQDEKCKRFASTYAGVVELRVVASDGSQLIIPAVDLIWNSQKLAQRPGDFRNGQKGILLFVFKSYQIDKSLQKKKRYNEETCLIKVN